MTTLQQRVNALRYRERLTFDEAACFVQYELDCTWRDAVNLIEEAAGSGRLAAFIEPTIEFWSGAIIEHADSLKSSAKRTDVMAWLESLTGPPAPLPQPQGEGTQRQDALALEIEDLCRTISNTGESVTATAVFGRLKRERGKGGCVQDISGDGKYLIWERSDGTPAKIDLKGIQKRIDRWLERNPRQSRQSPTKPPLIPPSPR